MRFTKLSTAAESILDEVTQSENATQLLNEKFDKVSSKEDAELRSILSELVEAGYLKIMWADNKPYQVFIQSSGKTYNERLLEYEENKRSSTTIINDNSISIGDGNKIKNSNLIGGNNQIHISKTESKKTFVDKHPVLVSVIISLITGVVLMFSFWDKLIQMIEELF